MVGNVQDVPKPGAALVGAMLALFSGCSSGDGSGDGSGSVQDDRFHGDSGDGSQRGDSGSGSASADGAPPLDSGLSHDPCTIGDTYDLAGHWTGDGDARDVAGDHHGSYRPAGSDTLSFAPGVHGLSFSFDLDGFVEVPDAAGLNPTGGITLAAWAYVTAYGTYREFVSKDGETDDRQYLLNVSNINRFRAHVGTVGGFQYFDGDTHVELDRWYHAAMTYDPETGELILYVDGAPDGSLEVPEASRCMIRTSQPVRIGGGAPEGLPQLLFPGRVDDVRLYGRALTPEEIQELAQHP